MNFNRHSRLEGQHAFLGASKYHWINYDTDKIVEVYVCATEEDAREIVNERYGYNVKAYYRDEE